MIAMVAELQAGDDDFVLRIARMLRLHEPGTKLFVFDPSQRRLRALHRKSCRMTVPLALKLSIAQHFDVAITEY